MAGAGAPANGQAAGRLWAAPHAHNARFTVCKPCLPRYDQVSSIAAGEQAPPAAAGKAVEPANEPLCSEFRFRNTAGAINDRAGSCRGCCTDARSSCSPSNASCCNRAPRALCHTTTMSMQVLATQRGSLAAPVASRPAALPAKVGRAPNALCSTSAQCLRLQRPHACCLPHRRRRAYPPPAASRLAGHVELTLSSHVPFYPSTGGARRSSPLGAPAAAEPAAAAAGGGTAPRGCGSGGAGWRCVGSGGEAGGCWHAPARVRACGAVPKGLQQADEGAAGGHHGAGLPQGQGAAVGLTPGVPKGMRACGCSALPLMEVLCQSCRQTFGVT